MPLVIEDGTGVADANSYITVDELRTFCADRGITFPVALVPDTATIAIFTPYLILANDFLEKIRQQYAGVMKFAGVQALSWPRSFVYIDYVYLDDTVIPQRLKNAQAQLVVEQMRGMALVTSQAGQGVGFIPPGVGGITPAIQKGGFVKERKTDVLTTTYSETVGANLQANMPAVYAFLQPLLVSNNFFGTVRV